MGEFPSSNNTKQEERSQEDVEQTQFSGQEIDTQENAAEMLTENMSFTKIAEEGGDIILEDERINMASHIAFYGLDNASKIYGLGPVLKAVASIGREAYEVKNPVGKIYAQLEPDSEKRSKLFQDITQEGLSGDIYNYGASKNIIEASLAFDNKTGNFFERPATGGGNVLFARKMQEQAPVAIYSVAELIDSLETSPEYDELRAKASEQNIDIVSYIVADVEKPDLSILFSKIEAALGNKSTNLLNEISNSEDKLTKKIDEIDGQKEQQLQQELSEYADKQTVLREQIQSTNIESLKTIFESSVEQVSNLAKQRSDEITQQSAEDKVTYFRSVGYDPIYIEILKRRLASIQNFSR